MDAIEALKQALYQLMLQNQLDFYWLQAPIDSTTLSVLPSGATPPYYVASMTNSIVNRMSRKEMIDFVIHIESVALDSQSAQQNNTYIYFLLQDTILPLNVDWQNYYTRRIRLGATAVNIEGTQLYKSSNYFEFKVVRNE